MQWNEVSVGHTARRVRPSFLTRGMLALNEWACFAGNLKVEIDRRQRPTPVFGFVSDHLRHWHQRGE